MIRIEELFKSIKSSNHDKEYGWIKDWVLNFHYFKMVPFDSKQAGLLSGAGEEDAYLLGKRIKKRYKNFY